MVIGEGTLGVQVRQQDNAGPVSSLKRKPPPKRGQSGVSSFGSLLDDLLAADSSQGEGSGLAVTAHGFSGRASLLRLPLALLRQAPATTSASTANNGTAKKTSAAMTTRLWSRLAR